MSRHPYVVVSPGEARCACSWTYRDPDPHRLGVAVAHHVGALPEADAPSWWCGHDACRDADGRPEPWCVHAEARP